jgi:hypothetical protein
MSEFLPAVQQPKDTMAMVLAEQAKAVVQARCVMAMKNPRVWDEVRTGILKECARPGFSEVAIYSKPIGSERITNFSVRFAEAFLRHMKNVMPETVVISDTEDSRLMRVSLTDLENNLTYSHDCIVSKTIERRKLKDGQDPLSERRNSKGEVTYTVRATEDDMAMKCGAVESKALRTLVLRIVPGDLQDECWEMLLATAKNKAAKDPDGERKKIVDAFSAVGVTATELEKYLARPLAQLSPADLADLRQVHTSIRGGEATWLDYVDQDGKRKSVSEEVTDMLKGKPEIIPAPAPEAPKRQRPASHLGPKKPTAEELRDMAPPPMTADEWEESKGAIAQHDAELARMSAEGMKSP